MENENQLIKTIEESGLEKNTAQMLKDKFVPFFDAADQWKKKADELIVTDETQIELIKGAREARLALRDIRVGADKTRKELKEDSLRYGKAVQGLYNIIEYLIVPIEKHLQEQEDFPRIQAEKRLNELREKRNDEARSLSEFIPANLDLGTLTEEDFSRLISGAKLQKQKQEEEIEAARIESERLEKERIERERIEAEEREKQRLENIRLKEEADKMAAEIKAERERAEDERKKREEEIELERAKAQKERDEIEAKRKKLEEEIERSRIAADRLLKEEQDRNKKLLEEKGNQGSWKPADSAPIKSPIKSEEDKIRIETFAKLIDELERPKMQSAQGKFYTLQADELLKKVSKYLRDNSEKI